MKKILSLVVCICILLITCVGYTSYASDEIKVTIDGKVQSYDVMPLIQNGRTLVPMRGIFEALGADINWDDSAKIVIGTKEDTTVSLQIGNNIAKVNGEEITLDVAASIISGRTMVPVRFISEALGCNVKWDSALATVVITSVNGVKPGMAKLVSSIHRNIPQTFEKSNDLNDILHYDFLTADEQEAAYANLRSQGKIVCTEEEFTGGIKPRTVEYGSYEVVDVEGQPFKKALRISCTSVPKSSAGFIARTSATPESEPGAGVAKTDKMLLAFRMRTVSGGENGVGKIQVQIEHPVTFKKALFEFAVAGKDWTVIYLPFSGVQDATDIGIRGGFYEQVVELGGIEIINFGPDFDASVFPVTYFNADEFLIDAQWRKDANARIEKIRKGDFSVVVKDNSGNVVPNAEVEFDMFEHEFHFGTAINTPIGNNPEYDKHFNMLYNAAVLEHWHKWGPYEQKPGESARQVQAAKASGAKYVRGHSVFWERDLSSDGNSYLTPEYMLTDEILSNRELFDEKCKEHVDDIVGDFLGEVCEWDVVNEIIRWKTHSSVYGEEVYKQWFDMAREAGGEDTMLYFNEYDVFRKEYTRLIETMIDMGTDFDALGIQLHAEKEGQYGTPSQYIKLFEELDKYGKKIKVTEFSYSIDDKNMQADYMRDIMIASFAEEDMLGFLMWGFWDGKNFAAHSPMYDTEWNIKPAGKMYIDLVYNKWWTRDAKAVTDEQGKATINGFYGDYDVTVTANGQTKTVSCAYHKGYENVLEIVLN